jgi:C_GCAxxG_C_C family probable redox protein
MASLDPEQAKSEALARFKKSGPDHVNCAQAVVAYALMRLDEDPEWIAAAGYMGGGIAGTGDVCGAMNGTALSLGIRDLALKERGVEDPPSSSDQLQGILRDFAARFGSCGCRELTGHDLSTPEGRNTFHLSEISGRCADYVEFAIDRLEPLLKDAAATA